MLRATTRTLATSIGLPWPLRWELSLGESLLLVPTFFMAVAFELFSDNFGKLGIPISLPGAVGSIPNFHPKLFPMELYLLWVGLLTLAQIRTWPIARVRHPLVLFSLFLFTFGIARAIPDLQANPLLVVRNTAFVWYLALPFMIALYPTPSLRWESFFRILYVVMFAYFAVNLAYPIYVGDPAKVFWSVDLGLLLALAYGFCSSERWGARLALTAIGFVLGLSYFSTVQRTTLVGLTITSLLLLVSASFLSGIFPKPRWRRVAWLTLGIGLSVFSVAALRAYQSGAASIVSTGVQVVKTADPKRRSENNEKGLEKFRYFMWMDAWNEFKSAPILGIGFLRPVVSRVYFGNGEFYDNSQGSFEQRSQMVTWKDSPPIAGPHNSYLNAIARLGVIGFGFFLLHLACGWLFLTRCYFACFFVLIWQMLYAFFNVSLEGPIRSFPILLLVGVALKLVVERSRPGSRDLALAGGKRGLFAPKPRNGSARKMGLVHVPYRLFGGEDHAVSILRGAYKTLGIEPIEIPSEGASGDLLIGAGRSLTTGSPAEWDALVKKHNIEFLHLNNIHATLGPAFLRWIISRGIPALMTVHNHRFYCTNGLALYGAEACKACRPGPSLLRPIIRNCNDSLPKSIYHSAAMVEIRGEDLLRRAVTLFLAPSPYIARELQISGISPKDIRVFPHAVSVANAAEKPPLPGADVVFLGRLSAEKGVTYLLEAARLLPGVSFMIIGEGPLEAAVSKAAATLQNLRFPGKMNQPEAFAVIRASRVVCVPSVCHESFSLVAAEALSLGRRLVVPDSQSFHHYLEAPYSAVPAIVTNPESLAYSITTALEQPALTDSEISVVRERFGIEGFHMRLRNVIGELGQ